MLTDFKRFNVKKLIHFGHGKTSLGLINTTKKINHNNVQGVMVKFVNHFVTTSVFRTASAHDMKNRFTSLPVPPHTRYSQYMYIHTIYFN